MWHRPVPHLDAVKVPLVGAVVGEKHEELREIDGAPQVDVTWEGVTGSIDHVVQNKETMFFGCG